MKDPTQENINLTCKMLNDMFIKIAKETESYADCKYQTHKKKQGE